jgi:hypothetical protein
MSSTAGSITGALIPIDGGLAVAIGISNEN